VRVNRRQLADVLGITLPTVTAWANAGMPAVVAGSKGVEWVFETADCVSWYAEHKFKRAQAPIDDPFEPGKKAETIEEASRRKEIAHADRAEVMVAKEAGRLVPIEEIAVVVMEENARVRARVLTIPNEIRPKVLTFLQNDRKAAEQLISDVESVVLEALAEIRSWAPEAEADVEPQVDQETVETEVEAENVADADG
jgi:phage terminase Nu1 subunit (DNA packaging protein)